MRVQKYTNFQYVKELFLIRIFTDCKYINCSGLAQQKYVFSEKKRVFVVHDHINGYRLPDNLHRTQVIGRDGHYENAVVVVVSRLNFRQVVAYFLIVTDGQIGQKNGFLHPRASFPLQIFHHQTLVNRRFDKLNELITHHHSPY